MIPTILAAIALGLAAIPAIVFLMNMSLYRVPGSEGVSADAKVSVLIPARNEEGLIAKAVNSVLKNRGVELGVIVLDDHSTDRTPEIVAGLARTDSRVRLVGAPPLPAGWCGKMHACSVLSREASHPYLVFMDADVVLSCDALARMVSFVEETGVDLASGFPREETGSLAEALVIPLIHFVLLGFLPIARMRRSGSEAYGAGCGQLFVAWREAYVKAGGHSAIRRSMHDGLTLPRAFRRAGLKTDLFDATPLATCRMYRGLKAVWNGMTKNAIEGIAAPRRILPFTVLLLGGQVLPFVLLVLCLATGCSASALALSAAAVGLAYSPRCVAAARFRQSWPGALLHPCGVLFLLTAKWYALARHLLGRPVTWRGRAYGPGGPSAEEG